VLRRRPDRTDGVSPLPGRRTGCETIDYGPLRLAYGYTYHANGLKQTLIYPDGSTYTYAYDANNELASVEIQGEGSITVNAFQWTAPTRITLPGGTLQAHSWNGLLQPTDQEATSPAGQRLLAVSNEYGSLRQLLRRDVDGISTEFSYDREPRLLGAASSDGRQTAYTLDPLANRLSDSAVPGAWRYDANNRLLRAGDTTYAYDANGNLTAKTQGGRLTRFFHDLADRLTRVEDGAGAVIARYGYDPMGRRLWKRVGDSITYFLYAQEGLIGEYNALGQQTAAWSSWPSPAPGRPWCCFPPIARPRRSSH
jgi:YD repeat-containing protein